MSEPNGFRNADGNAQRSYNAASDLYDERCDR